MWPFSRKHAPVAARPDDKHLNPPPPYDVLLTVEFADGRTLSDTVEITPAYRSEALPWSERLIHYLHHLGEPKIENGFLVYRQKGADGDSTRIAVSGIRIWSTRRVKEPTHDAG